MQKNVTTSDQDETLSGTIERITFHNTTNGFCVLRVKVTDRRELVTVTGNAPQISAGEIISCQGNWLNDSRFGLQFRAKSLQTTPPASVTGMEKYLSSGIIKGIGPRFAKKLITAFGATVFDVIEKQPERLYELDGIGEKRIQSVISAWSEQKSIRHIMVFLQSHAITTARAVRIFKTYGNDAIRLIKENPYRLATDIHGIGFKMADALALKLGIEPISLIRARAGVQYVLQELCQRGHCAAPREKLEKSATKLLNIEEERICQAIDAEISAGHLIPDCIDGTMCLFPLTFHRTESSVTSHLLRLLLTKNTGQPINSQRAIPWVEKKIAIQLSLSQKQAIEKVIDSKISIITGGPGVGKTTVINSILKILQAARRSVALCAPTGRAARRLMETTGMSAKTIHRLLEFDPSIFAFRHHQENPLPIDVLIVDESSMIDLMLFHSLLKALPDHTTLILAGDVDQLPSVGSGAVLQDLIHSGVIPVARLTEIFRQAAGSEIIQNAHRINHGNLPIQGDKKSDFFLISAETPEEIREQLLSLVAHRIPSNFQCNPIRDIQVLTPMNRGGLGSIALNSDLQKLLNGHAEPKLTRFGWTFAPGDKIIQTINNYQKEVFNGDIGHIQAIHQEEGQVTIDFETRLITYDFNELDEIALAYAISIHKSQGSEFPIIVMPLATQHYALLARNLLYTGVTRGKKLVVLVAQKKAVQIAVSNNQENRRLTRLAGRLMEAWDAKNK